MTDNSDKIRGGMVGGAVGDALGFPVEFYTEEQIFKNFGEEGITEYSLCGDTALISDDTQMALFTADGMLRARAELKNPTVEEYTKSIYESYLNWLYTQDKDYPLGAGVARSALLHREELHSRRAPGWTCLSALQSGSCGSFDLKLNDSKGCGGVMRVAPVALCLAQNGAASEEKIGELAARAAAITHSHPLGYIPAAFLAILLCKFIRGEKDCENAVAVSLYKTKKIFPQDEEFDYFYSLVVKAAMLAEDNDVADDLDAINEIGAGWVAEETVAIAVYCMLRYSGSFEKAVVASVNHGGDSDSTGAVTGNLMGALLGYRNIPEKYLNQLELKGLLLELAQKIQG